jgi:DNA-binding MarR family transcriptional regulator
VFGVQGLDGVEFNIDMSMKAVSIRMSTAKARPAARVAPVAAPPKKGAAPRAKNTEAPSEPAPRRAARPPAAVPANEVEVNRYLAAYIMGVANRLANGASNHYRSRFGMGMSEWRAMMAIGTSSHRIVREVAHMADLDYAAASKSLKVLAQRGLVEIEQTQRRGRAAIASLTPEGLVVYRQLCESARRRQRRLLAPFNAEEVQTLWALLQRIEAQVPHMNAGS